MTRSDDNHLLPVRRTVHFSGHVQGVGFRYITRDIASRADVTGQVRNLSDGRVELVAEGTSVALDHFQRAIEEAMRGHVREVAVTESAATGEFTSFCIAF